MEIRTVPNFLKLRDVGPIVESRKPLASFISANVERDKDGSFRIPSSFLEQFGGKLYYHLNIKCNNIIWHAIFDKDRKKITGLYDFLTFYDLRMYSVVIFDYFGYGNFVVKSYKHTATSMVNPTIDPVLFFKNDNSRNLRMDQFIYGRNKLEIEKYIGMVSYNAVKHITEVFKIEVNGVEKRQESQYLELQKDLEDLYNNWKGMDTIFLTLGMFMWKIEVCWDGGSCKFGKGWYKFLKELDISTGDVISLYIVDAPDIVLTCIFKKDELNFEKEEGKRDGRRSFYKILVETTIKHGFVLPALIGVETEKYLSGVEKILIYGMEWQIGYHDKFRTIYGLEKVFKHFNLVAFDSLHFSFEMDGVLCGRIFKSDGMEIIYSTPGKSCPAEKYKNCFLYEESRRDSNLDGDDTKLMDVVTQCEVPTHTVNLPSLIENVVPDDIDQTLPDVMEIVEPDFIQIDEDPNLDIGEAKLLDIISQSQVPNGDVSMPEVIQNVVPAMIEAIVPDEIENVAADMIENVEDAMIYQFSKRLITCNMNKRCHGMHIPNNMRFQNRDWAKGDTVTFRTALGTWNIRIVLNNGRARFSGGWSKFVKDQKLKINDNLRFTLREEDDTAVFDIEVNPTN